MIPYGRQEILQRDIDRVLAVLNGDYLTGGPEICRFEDEIIKATGARFATACSSGTSALHLALLAIGCKEGDAVIVPAITFAATANAVIYCGATPIFADIDPLSKNISIESMKSAIDIASQSGLNLKAVIPVHYAGLSADMSPICELARKYEMSIIEDACHAMGGRYKAAPIGSCRYSDFTCFSFHPVKHIATGEGGAVTTNSKVYQSRLKGFRSHGITKEPSTFIQKDLSQTNGEINSWYQEMQTLGFNYRMSDINAALGCSQIERINENISRRNEIAFRYRESFSSVPWISLDSGEHDGVHAYHLFTLNIDFRNLSTTRNRVIEQLGKSGVGTQVHYLPVYKHLYYQKNLDKWYKCQTSVAEKHYENTLSIPMFASMSDNDVNHVIKSIYELGGEI